jgi:hypothetical protein
MFLAKQDASQDKTAEEQSISRRLGNDSQSAVTGKGDIGGVEISKRIQIPHSAGTWIHDMRTDQEPRFLSHNVEATKINARCLAGLKTGIGGAIIK